MIANLNSKELNHFAEIQLDKQNSLIFNLNVIVHGLRDHQPNQRNKGKVIATTCWQNSKFRKVHTRYG